MSHSSFMVSNPGMVPDDQAARAFEAYRGAREHLVRLAPDALLVLGTDHFNSLFLDLLPQFCIGLSASYDGCRDNMPELSVPGDPTLANTIVTGLLARGFDPALSHELRLDHSFFSPLYFVTPDMDVPIVPVITNTITDPFPPPRRSVDIGRALGRILDEDASSTRVVVIGSGGLSHWLGLPQQGQINSDFDREFLDRFRAGDLDWLESLSTEDLYTRAGNGGQEIRNWLAVRGCLPDGPVDVRYYEPIPGWFGGWAVASVEADTTAPLVAAGGR